MSVNYEQIAEQLSAGGFGKSCLTPSRKNIVTVIKVMQELMFPCFFSCECDLCRSTAEKVEALKNKLSFEIRTAIAGKDGFASPDEISAEIVSLLPEIQKKLMMDIKAIYEGDPAATSPEEVVLSYPGFLAICIYRIAHEFYIRKIPLIPRIMTEYAHEKTGVDIHAGATIGDYFCIDHGTGIVIGETTTIGSRVKIYQGVTLGAKSFELDEDGNPVKGIKRHPDIGNNVVIYANATILGGNTKIGDNCVIGGNVWLTHSVPEGKVVYYNSDSTKA